MTKSGRFSRRQKRITFANASSVLGSTQNCAGPPTRKVVCFASGSDSLTSPPVPDDRFQFLRHHQFRRKPRQLFVYIAGAKTQDEIACLEHPSDIGVHSIQPRVEGGNRAMTVLRDRVAIVCPVIPGNTGSLAA